jgi:hypothetical protein
MRSCCDGRRDGDGYTYLILVLPLYLCVIFSNIGDGPRCPRSEQMNLTKKASRHQSLEDAKVGMHTAMYSSGQGPNAQKAFGFDKRIVIIREYTTSTFTTQQVPRCKGNCERSMSLSSASL